MFYHKTAKPHVTESAFSLVIAFVYANVTNIEVTGCGAYFCLFFLCRFGRVTSGCFISFIVKYVYV